MNDIVTHPLAMDGKDPSNLRGDRVTAERYFSPDFMKREWDQVWTKVWQIAGRRNQMSEAGDYIVHNFMNESVFIVQQPDGSLKGFYNVCQHRGQRLVKQDGGQDAFTCPYHGWKWGLDGRLEDLPDRDDFPQGDPCGKLSLKSVRVDMWAGFVWYTMDENAPPLLEYLAPIPEVCKNYQWERLVRVRWVRVELNCNWKFFADNFRESYHTRTAHPQVAPYVDQDHFTSRFEMYRTGHSRIIQMGRPSLRDRLPEGDDVPFDETLRDWEIDPDSYADFETKVTQGWLDLKAAKRRLWKERGYLHYKDLTDEELTENPFMSIFPNVSIGCAADGMSFFRSEPHPRDPEKMYFDLWDFAYPTEQGGAQYRHRLAKTFLEVKEAELDYRIYDNGRGVQDLAELVVFQDWELTEGQQAGWHSRGYEENLYLSGQETRVRHFEEVLNDYMAGNPPGR